MGEILYVVRRNQESRQCQGLGTIFKPLNDSGRHCRSFHMFGPMKEALRGGRFSSDDEVIGAVQYLLKMQPKKLFCDGIKKLAKRWNRCVEVERDYVEK
jgi:hypothetical protein